MRFEVRAMAAADAAEVAAWHYEDEYAFYDFEADADDMAELLDPAGWGDSYYAADGAAFNRRAIVVYQRAGFVEVERFEHRTNGGLHPFLRMSRPA